MGRKAVNNVASDIFSEILPPRPFCLALEQTGCLKVLFLITTEIWTL